MIIRYRHFRRRDQIEFTWIFELEQIGFKLRQLPGSEERTAIDDERRQCFEIAVFARLHVEHEVDERAFETCARAVQDRETRRCNLRSTFEIEYAECGAEIDVVLRLEREFRLCAPATSLSIR